MANGSKRIDSGSVQSGGGKAKPRRLGRGLNALLSPDPVKVQAAGKPEPAANDAPATPKPESTTETGGESIRSVAVGAIDASPSSRGVCSTTRRSRALRRRSASRASCSRCWFGRAAIASS